jgi:hypothetical protein
MRADRLDYSPQVEDLVAMTWTDPQCTQLLVGGINDRMLVFDLTRGSLLKEVGSVFISFHFLLSLSPCSSDSHWL